MFHKLVFSMVCASALLLLATPSEAQTANYQDWWWNPNEAGRGLNIGQQGNTLFIAWFAYDENGEGMWLTMTSQLSNNAVSGDLISTAGPPLGETFEPHAVIETVVGQATLTFTDHHHANFNYIVNGVSDSVQLQRFSFSPVPIEGLYVGGTALHRTGCSFIRDGLYGSFLSYHISARKLTMTITAVSLEDPNARCTYSGTYQQHGSKLAASGTFSCASGVRGTWSSNNLTFSDHGFIGKIILQDTIEETCQRTGSISATRY